MADGIDATTLLIITRNGMGHAEEALSQLLVGKFLSLLLEDHGLPGAIAFYTEGVKLVCNGSPALASLKALEERGVRLIICNTCLAHFGLTDEVAVGIKGGMGDIMAAMRTAAKVIPL